MKNLILLAFLFVAVGAVSLSTGNTTTVAPSTVSDVYTEVEDTTKKKKKGSFLKKMQKGIKNLSGEGSGSGEQKLTVNEEGVEEEEAEENKTTEEEKK